MSPPSTPLYKYTVSHYRNPAVSEEGFRKWYQEEHLPYALPLMKKHGITKFNVVSIQAPSIRHMGLTLECKALYALQQR